MPFNFAPSNRADAPSVFAVLRSSLKYPKLLACICGTFSHSISAIFETSTFVARARCWRWCFSFVRLVLREFTDLSRVVVSCRSGALASPSPSGIEFKPLPALVLSGVSPSYAWVLLALRRAWISWSASSHPKCVSVTTTRSCFLGRNPCCTACHPSFTSFRQHQQRNEGRERERGEKQGAKEYTGRMTRTSQIAQEWDLYRT